MKLNLAIATAALTLMGASAQAQLTFTASQTSTIDPSNGYTVFTGFVINSLTATSSVPLDGSTVTSALPFIDTQADFNFSDLPLTLAPGDSHRFDNLFEADLTKGSIGGTTYQLTSGGPTVASFTFPTTSAVPEPGSLALLASSVIGGGLFVARRRRK